jgi:hypothetical protein
MASDSKKTRQCKYLHLFLFADHRRLMPLGFFFFFCYAQQMALRTTSLKNAYSGHVRSLQIIREGGREGEGAAAAAERLESITPLEYTDCVMCIMARLQIPQIMVSKPGVVPYWQRGGWVRRGCDAIKNLMFNSAQMRPPGLIRPSVHPSHNCLRGWIPTNVGITGRHFHLKIFYYTNIFAYAALGPVVTSETLLKNS